MATVDIKDAKGKSAGKADLADAVYGIEPNMHVMHRTVLAQQNSWRQGTANTKTRSMVRGGGKKPWRQKGTGRARQGTIRAPHWRGGGVVFGPHSRLYIQKVNKKESKLAMRSALSAKLADGELIVVKDFDFDVPSTKKAAEIINRVSAALTPEALVKMNDESVNGKRSAADIAHEFLVSAGIIQ